MTSVDEGLAGGRRGTADHGLPSLVNGVSDQTAPSQLEYGVMKGNLTEREQNRERSQ